MKNDIIKGGRDGDSTKVLNKQSAEINRESVEETQKRAVSGATSSQRILNKNSEDEEEKPKERHDSTTRDFRTFREEQGLMQAVKAINLLTLRRVQKAAAYLMPKQGAR